MSVKVIVDRKMGTYHTEHPDLYYPINYGYIPDVMGGDGEEQDAYILGVEKPIDKFEGEVIAVIHRINDAEDKWVVASSYKYTDEEIESAIAFQEQYFEHKLIRKVGETDEKI